MALAVIRPGDRGYDAALARLVHGDAAGAEPALILQPTAEEELQEAIRLVQAEGWPLCVASGGHSAHAARSGAAMLDLAAHWQRIELLDHGERVRIQAGAAMGALLQALAPAGRMVPVGTHATPGFGLLTMGGVGHLSRSHGLTLDGIEELRGYTLNGERLVLRADGPDPEAWLLMRGAAVFLAVVTEATLRTHLRRPLVMQRALQPLQSLQGLLQRAETLPDEASCSFILGCPPAGHGPQLLTVAVAVADGPGETALQQAVPCQWRDWAAGLELLPAFELPDAQGAVSALPPPAADRHQRMRTRVYSLSWPAGQADRLAPLLQEAMARLPNPDCRIDLQHVGGRVNSVPPLASAYTGRQAEWSIVVTAVYAPDAPEALAAQAWAERCARSLLPWAQHYYIVQRHPGTSLYASELELAYGSLLEPLRRRKAQWDPAGQLPSL